MTVFRLKGVLKLTERKKERKEEREREREHSLLPKQHSKTMIMICQFHETPPFFQ